MGSPWPPGQPGHAGQGRWPVAPRQPSTALSSRAPERPPSPAPPHRGTGCAPASVTGQGSGHASDADGTSAEKGATIIPISHNVNVSHARSPTSRATREGVSTKQRGTNLRDRKREGCTPKQAERQAGCWGGMPGHRGLFPPLSAHWDAGQELREGAGDKTMEGSGNSLAVARPGVALQ